MKTSTATFAGSLLAACTLFAAPAALAASFQTRVVAEGLHRPTGIVAANGNVLYFSEVPMPGVAGGTNAVKELKLGSGRVRTLHQGEPEPMNLAYDQAGILYWTCRSAGVILEQAVHEDASAAAALLTGLAKPTGIAIDRESNVYFTQVPDPGVPGAGNSVAVVSASDASSVINLSEGEPEPADVAASRDGRIYWTCKTAGVILTRSPEGQTALLLSGLTHPNGIALDDRRAVLYWTELPTPGVSGAQGGENKVWGYDLGQQKKFLVDAGDPYPSDITVAPNGRLYWTCTSAGVIVEARPKQR